MTDQARYAQRHDEHAPPNTKTEKTIMRILKQQTMKPRDLVEEMIRRGFKELDARASIWALLDRGYLHLTWDRLLEAHPERISPAPTDLV